MNRTKNLLLPSAVIMAAFIAVAGSALVSNLQATAETTTANSTAKAAQPDQSQSSHVGSNGTKEELLTGDTAEKVKTAALAAVPGGTILRVENDAEGATYEAHMTKADGSQVTVKLDASFKVTGTETGGPGGPGGRQ